MHIQKTVTLLAALFCSVLSFQALAAGEPPLKLAPGRPTVPENHGNALGLFGLAEKYSKGAPGLPADKAKAFELFKKSAELGYMPAQYNVALMYAEGEGVAHNEAEAVRWYLKAANQGDADALFSLGRHYETGRGVAKDPLTASMWYEKAADKGLAAAQYNLARLYDNGTGVDMDKTRALALYTQAASQGLARAQHNLANMYNFGKGVPVNYERANHWYTQAARQGLDESIKMLAEKNYLGRSGLAVDYKQALVWFKEMAKRDDAYGQYMVGLMYEEGYGVAKDPAIAADMYQASAFGYNKDAQYNLAGLFRTGTGVPQSAEEAYFWYSIVAGTVDSPAAVKYEAMMKADLDAATVDKADLKVKRFLRLQKAKRLHMW